MRVSTLAKELSVSSKDLIAKCKEVGIKVSHHANNLTDEEAGFVRNSFQPKAVRIIDLSRLEGSGKKPPRKDKRTDSRGPGAQRGGQRGDRPAGRGGDRPGGPPRGGDRSARPPRTGGGPPRRPMAGGPPAAAPVDAKGTASRKDRSRGKKDRDSRTSNFFSKDDFNNISGGTRFLRKSNKKGGNRKGGNRREDDSSISRRPDPTPVENLGPVDIETPISVREFSQIAGIKVNEIIAHLMRNGIMKNLNNYLGAEEVLEIADNFGREINIKEEEDELEKLESETVETVKQTDERPPVVTILGHVDHGKTSLLDKIRETNIVEKEAGGITQHIRSYKVNWKGKEVAFVDTPGHAAFTEMRARGANVTDIILLIVAADDGVMPQTVESINHAKAAKAPLIVVINKCDLATSNVERVKQQLSTHELLIEDWGGDTICCEVSAISGDGIDNLLEMIQLQAEVLELKCAPNEPARGRVIESELSKGLGVVTKVIVQDGTLKRGDFVVCGSTYGRIKDVYSDMGKRVDSAGPSTPVGITGLEEIPDAGEMFIAVDSIQKARELSETRKERERREEQFNKQQNVTLETLTQQMVDKNKNELNVIVKGDVLGSIEVIEKSLLEIKHDEIKINVVHRAVGGVNESDIVLADASDAVVLGFHVTANSKARDLARQKQVEIRTYQVVYELLDDVKASLSGLLAPESIEKIVGHAEVRQVIKVPKIGNIAGSYVLDGYITRNAEVRIARNDVVIYSGKVAGLNRFKDSVKEVKQGFECGILIEGFDDVKEGDVFEVVEHEQIARTID